MTLSFHLVPDRAAARRLRREIAQAGMGFDRAVGSWPDLLERARDAYLVPPPGDDWAERLSDAVAEVPDAFWTRSLAAAPEETAAVIRNALEEVLAASAPGTRPDLDTVADARARRHLSDLLRLWDAAGCVLPPDLAVVRAVLDAPAPLRPIAVQVAPEVRPGPWQRALLARLSADAGGVVPDLPEPPPAPEASGALTHLRGGLFKADAGPAVPLDGSLQWIGLRDTWEAADVAAGMARQAMADGMAPADVGLLVPAAAAWHGALASAFRRAGLPLSHLGRSRSVRDLGREAVALFLRCQKAPPPGMALASLMASPLMPWPATMGSRLAEAALDGPRRLRLDDEAPEDWQTVVRLVRAREAETAAALAGRLGVFLKHLSADARLAPHRARAEEAAGQAMALLAGREDTPWNDLFRAIQPGAMTHEDPAEVWREGVTVLDADLEPWRPVRRLIVLGFNAGAWPVPPAVSPVFDAVEAQALRDAGLEVETPETLLAHRRALLRRQLAVASERADFLVCRRDGTGSALEPSETLVFMHRLLGGVPERPEELVLDLDAAEERARIAGVPLAPDAPAIPPRPIVAHDLDLGRDLVRLHAAEGEPPRAFSPSRLETLMVSPLAWLLQRVGAEPVAWAPEDLDPARKGSVAHKVFEALFRPRAPLPDEKTLTRALPAAFDAAVADVAPFLDAPEWSVERRHLVTEVTTTARAWRALLDATGAEVVEAEVHLSGTLDKKKALPLNGFADVILALPDGRLVVVDYKKSKSGQRRDRMAKGWDAQADLYRRMLTTGGPVDDEARERLGAVKAGDVAVLYFAMNDAVALTDRAEWFGGGLSSLVGVEGDVAASVTGRIRDRLAALSAGQVPLNRAGDGAWLEKEAAIKPYALDVSPLIGLFTLPDEDDETAAEEAAQ